MARPLDQCFLMTPEDRKELLQNITRGSIDEPVEDLPGDPKLRIATLVTRRNALIVGIQKAQRDGDLTAVTRLRNAVIAANAKIAGANHEVVNARPVIRKS